MNAHTRKRFLARASDSLIVHTGLVLLTRECLPGVDERIAEQICKRWNLSDRDYDLLSLCCWPNEAQNLVGCHGLYELIGERIGLIPGIYREPGFGAEAGCWKLDLDPRHSGTGFLMPIRNHHRWCYELRAFRSWRDESGFQVRVRAQAA